MTAASAPAGSDVGDRASNKATTRTLHVLRAFWNSPGSRGVTELSRELGMTKSMVYRALSTLVEQQLLVRDPSGSRYVLGYGILELNPLNAVEPELPELVAPFMEQMHRMSSETVTLNVPVGREVLTIDGIEGRGTVARRVPIGRRVPLHCNASGRAILAFKTDAEVGRYLVEPLERFTPTTLTTPEEVWQEVALVRERGHALGYHDHAPNAGGVAFPILDGLRRPLGALTVSGPKDRLTPQRIAELLPDLTTISRELGRRSRLRRRRGDTSNARA